MPPTLQNVVEQYLSAIRTAHSVGTHTAETTFYTPFANLLNAIGQRLKPRVHYQAHPAAHGGSLVDGGLFPLSVSSQSAPLPGQLPERGAVEIKAPGTSLATLAQSAQVRRYLQTYGLCLISNYHQFQLLELRNGQPHILETYDLTVTAEDLWHLPLKPLVAEHAETLPDFLLRVMTRKVPLEKPKDVAWLLASYAREARARAEHHDLPAFRNVKAALEESLGIQFEGEKGEHFFRSTLVQTLFYGIFSAWVLWWRTPEGKAPDARFDWRFTVDNLRIPVLRSLFHAVSERGALNTVQIIEVLDNATDALNRVQKAIFFATFNDEQAVAYFYEPFLEAFDPQLRKELGVWYTPRQIVHYQVERVDHLLRTELGQPLGLASPAVRILDPCCGTGAYLVAVLERIHRTLLAEAGDDTALVSAALRTAALTRVFGFEIMPAPFVIAHMEIARLLDDARAPLAGTERAGIFLTNALTGWIPEVHPQSVLSEEFRREREDSEHIKQQGTILVILGNPPYNGYAGIARIEEERGLTTAYRAPVAGLPAPQGQGLNDLYIRFFRIAERRIASNRDGQGIVSFISNNAWLDGLSHTTMRHHYLQTFQQIYIDNLNGDKYRTGKTTPDGKPDPSAFSTSQNREGIQVGTAIATMVRNTALASANPLIRDLWGTGKLSHLERESRREHEPTYSQLTPAPALGNPLAHRLHSTAYTSWPKLPELFPISFPGIKTSRDALLVDIDRDALERRMKQYLDRQLSDAEMALIVPSAMESTARFNATETRRKLRERGFQPPSENRYSFRPWQVIRYTYRPFDVRWLYWEPETKLLDEKREEYLVCTPYPVATIIAQQKSRVGADPVQCVTAVSCLDLMDRSASCFPAALVAEANFNWLDSNSDKLSGPVPFCAPNLSIAALSYLAEFGSNFSSFAIPRLPSLQGNPVFFHTLAIMHSPQYRTENAGALLGDWPRIALPATADLLSQSAALGRQLAELLDAESAVSLKREWSFLAALQFPSSTLNPEHLALTAGWGGRGQGSTVMPGRGKTTLRPWTPLERTRIAALTATQSLSLEAALALLGETCLDIHLNGESLWSAVPANVWSYTLGGYQVLKKWLSYREQPLLGRPLRSDESDYFAQVVRRIAAILLLGPALDASYQAILPTATALPPAL